MERWSANTFLWLAVVGTTVAVLMVPLMEYLQHGTLPLWLHIPLTLLVLTLMAVGAAITGVTLVEYRSRSLHNRQQT